MTNATGYKQPWLKSASFDGLFILLPGLLALLITFFLPAQYKHTDEMPVWAWVVLVLLVDVAHVYSTLFRTYFDKERFSKYRVLYLFIPIACFITGVLLYSVSASLFWRILAYLAVFHFVRQQYGFVRLYSRYEQQQSSGAVIDTVTIYAATLYPLIYWHCTPGRNFNWFVKGDFVTGDMSMLSNVAFYVYCLIVATYVVKEVLGCVRTRTINVPRNVLISGTLFTWYFGIVHFNGDMAFTLLNVVAHGIPYIALIWMQEQQSITQKARNNVSAGKIAIRLFYFLLIILVLSYLEEGLWDGMVWREHESLFPVFSMLPRLTSQEVLSVLVPLLSLPQSTHYVLDGFIWRKRFQ